MIKVERFYHRFTNMGKNEVKVPCLWKLFFYFIFKMTFLGLFELFLMKREEGKSGRQRGMTCRKRPAAGLEPGPLQ